MPNQRIVSATPGGPGQDYIYILTGSSETSGDHFICTFDDNGGYLAQSISSEVPNTFIYLPCIVAAWVPTFSRRVL